MSALRLLILAVLPLLAATCQPAGQPALPPSLEMLQGTWLHSREEDQGDTMVYRPNTYSFPPSRGRTGWAIGPFGRFTQYDIAPTDGLEGQPGTWTLLDGNRLRIQLTGADSSGTYELQILKIAGKKLYLRRIEAGK